MESRDKYDKKQKTSQPVRIAKGLKESINEFLQTEKAKKLGYRFESDVVNAAVRGFLVTSGFPEYLEDTESEPDQ